MFAWIRQVISVSFMNLRTMPQRLGSAVVAMVGIGGVVLVLVAVLSIAQGFRSTLASAGAEDTAIVLRGGSDSEMMSGLQLDDTRLIADAPGVARGPDGQPLASAELFVVINLPKKSTGTDANVPLRGVQMAAFDVRENVEILEGRRFEPGLNEVIVGEGARTHFADLEVGDVLDLGETQWTVVGVFTTNGTIADSEIWTDAKVLQPAYRRGSTFQSVYAKLESPEAFTAFKDSLTTNPQLDVDVERESEYFASQSEALTTMVGILGIPVALLMGLGAIFGAIITMYSAVVNRSREIATLRALGFARLPVVISVMVEAFVLAFVGGLAGAGLAFLGFNGYQAATLNWQTFSQVTFAFAVTPTLMTLGLVYALVLGFVGSLIPAFQAARVPVAAALREA